VRCRLFFFTLQTKLIHLPRSQTATSTTLSLTPAPPPPEGSVTPSSNASSFTLSPPSRHRYPFFVSPSHLYSLLLLFFISLPLEPLRSALCFCHASCGHPFSRSLLLSRGRRRDELLGFSLCADFQRRRQRESEALHVPKTEGNE
jgi:hypothetical protein